MAKKPETSKPTTSPRNPGLVIRKPTFIQELQRKAEKRAEERKIEEEKDRERYEKETEEARQKIAKAKELAQNKREEEGRKALKEDSVSVKGLGSCLAARTEGKEPVLTHQDLVSMCHEMNRDMPFLSPLMPSSPVFPTSISPAVTSTVNTPEVKDIRVSIRRVLLTKVESVGNHGSSSAQDRASLIETTKASEYDHSQDVVDPLGGDIAILEKVSPPVPGSLISSTRDVDTSEDVCIVELPHSVENAGVVKDNFNTLFTFSDMDIPSDPQPAPVVNNSQLREIERELDEIDATIGFPTQHDVGISDVPKDNNADYDLLREILRTNGIIDSTDQFPPIFPTEGRDGHEICVVSSSQTTLHDEDEMQFVKEELDDDDDDVVVIEPSPTTLPDASAVTIPSFQVPLPWTSSDADGMLELMLKRDKWDAADLTRMLVDYLKGRVQTPWVYHMAKHFVIAMWTFAHGISTQEPEDVSVVLFSSTLKKKMESAVLGRPTAPMKGGSLPWTTEDSGVVINELLASPTPWIMSHVARKLIQEDFSPAYFGIIKSVLRFTLMTYLRLQAMNNSRVGREVKVGENYEGPRMSLSVMDGLASVYIHTAPDSPIKS